MKPANGDFHHQAMMHPAPPTLPNPCALKRPQEMLDGGVSRKRYTTEQIIRLLGEEEVALAQGETAAQVCRTLGIAEQKFYPSHQNIVV